MEEIKISAKTLEEAITKACIELGVPSDMLDYSVVSQGNNGFLGLGFGAKPYIISAKVKKEETKAAPSENKKNAPVKDVKEVSKTVNKVKDEKSLRNERKAEASEPVKAPEAKPEKILKDEPVQKNNEIRTNEPSSDKDPGERARIFLQNLFNSMEMNINYSSKYDAEKNELIINLSGDDMGILIGKRGQTLDALQYLTSQVVNKHQSGYIRVKLDTENYRERRKETLETFAINMARKVRRNNRPIVLEPMNAYERRIIHSVLQGESDVITRSEGEEPYRHVVICPVKKRNAR